MVVKSCCFCVPLNYGCMVIAIFVICFHSVEMIAHGKDTVFMHDHEEVKSKWAIFLQSAIISIGIIASILLFYGSYKRKRSLIILWLVVFVITFVIYCSMAIFESVVYDPIVWITLLQFGILVVLIYFLIIVFSFCRQLGTAHADDDFI